MNTRTLDVALRVAADLSNAAQELATLAAKLEGLQGAGQSAAQGLDASANAAGKNSTATQSSATAAKAAANAQTALANAARNTAQVQQKAAISAAQHAQAMRQLPMPVTDIVTGLASGQSVFMVAIQQGGQLKDSFGGVAPAARALLGSISPLTVGVAAGAAAFAAIGVAAYQGYQEMRAFERGVISTGYAAGVTAGQVADMAGRVGAATGSYGDATVAMQALSASGKLTGDSLEAATSAAVNLSKLTGDSIESTTDKIIKLAESPSAMLVKLNEQYHFLTSAVLEHVRSLEDQGRAEDAVKAAVEDFARVHSQRAAEAEAQAGTLERAWKGLGEVIAGIWRDLKNVGRTDAEYRLEAAKRALGDAQTRAAGRSMPFDPSRYNAEIAALEKQVAAEQQAAKGRAATQAAEDKRVKDSDEQRKKAKKANEDAERNWDQRALGDLSKKEKLEERIKQIRADGALLKKSDAEIDQQITNARARYAESLPKAKKPGKTDAQQSEDAAQREIDSLTKQIYLLAQLSDGERRASHEAQARFEIEQGASAHASKAAKDKLIATAKQLDADEAERKKTEEATKAADDAQKAYDRLRDSLETPIESAMADVKKGVDVLNDVLARGRINADQYKDALDRLLKKSETKAPELPGQFRQMGGPLGDGMDLAAYGQQLDKWRQDEIQKNDAYLAAKRRSEVEHQQRMQEIRNEYDQRQNAYSQAQSQFMLGTASSLFGSLAEIARNGAGEQSKTYRALFALSQGFAVAQALIAVYQNAAEASKKAGGYPYNIPIIAGAIAQGLAIVAQIRSVQPSGYATGGHIRGPGSGTSDDVLIWASNGEHMIRERSASQPGARGFLDDFNARGMPAIYDWARLGKYANGGQITAMPEPSFRPSAPGASPVSMQNDMSVYVLNDRAQLVEYLTKHPKMRQAIVLEASENGGAIRASWGS